ncbi:MAG: carboxypeptidase regulatory-like domain-containing protein [Sphaerochaetaceae bacterium]|nr:carboxypeptidase regulatory-like domain-containing protein [Sphaerochaetaceae bacterium]
MFNLKRTIVAICFLLSVLFVFTSCEEEPQIIQNASPLIKGSITVPASSGLSVSDIWYKVIDNGSTVYVGKVKSDGTFSVSGLSTEKKYDIIFSSIEPNHNNYGSRSVSTEVGGWICDVVAAIHEGCDVGSVKMRPLGTIKGRVIKSGATDNADVTVFIPGTSYMAITDEDGNFAITNVPQGTMRLRYTTNDYLAVVKEGIILDSQDDTTSPVITVPDATLVEAYGTVQGSAILVGTSDHAGINIKLENETSSSEGTTSVDGSFLINRVKPGTYRAIITKAGYISQTIEDINIEAGITNLIENQIKLIANGGTIIGTISTNDNNTEKAGVLVLANSTDDKYSYTTTTVLNGIYTLTNCYPTTYTITYSKTGYASHVKQNVKVIAGDSTRIEEIVLSSKSGGIKGLVVDKDNNPIVGAQVTIGTYTALTDENGKYERTDLALGSYTITVSKDGYNSKSLTEQVSVESSKTTDAGTVKLVSVYGSLTGTVSLNDNSSKEGISVTATSADSKNIYTAITNVEGKYTINNMLPSTYTLVLSKTGFANGNGLVSIVSDNVTTVPEIVLKSTTGSISGKVLLSDNTSTTSVSVLLKGTKNYSITVSTDGTFSKIEVDEGFYTVEISKEGYTTKTIENVQIESAKNTNLDDTILQLNTGSITGKVSYEGGTDYSSVVVVALSMDDDTIRYTLPTAADGTYFKSGIKPGTYAIQISLTGYLSDNTKTVEVVKGQTTEVDSVVLKNMNGKVKGNVTLDGAANHEGVNILLLQEGNPTSYSTITNQTGDYIINNVAPGTYTILASKDGYVSSNDKLVTIVPATESTVDSISLAVSIRSITGKVDLELTNDEAGALITATNINENTLIYSAISNSDGNYSLAGMKPGEYLISISKAGYGTVTLPTVSVVSSSVSNLDKVDLIIDRGTIAGIVVLEGSESDCSGVLVELLGTEYSTTTAVDGSYSIAVPSKNYPGGLRFSKTDYALSSHTDTIPVLTDSTYAIPTQNMTITHTTIKGIVDIKATDNDSGVRVYVEGKSEYDITTDSTGVFEFNHVPLGDVKVHFVRENAPEVISNLTLARQPENNLGTVEIIPNSASIKGRVVLDKVGSTKGVTITVTTAGVSGQLSTTTDDTGYFYLSNLISTGTHTVTISKEGWDTETININNLEPLEIRDLTETEPITLKDTTKPILTSVVINKGAGSTSERTVTVTLTASDAGSGLSKMQYSFDGILDDTVEVWNYITEFTVELPQYNGEKTIYVKVFDLAGNECSTIKSYTISLTNTETTITGGVLDSTKLHWTKEYSPYRVTGSIKVAEGCELIIDPGVVVKFEGNSYLHVDGKLTAIGNESQRIQMYGVNNGFDGIKIKKDNNSKLVYVDIFDGNKGITGSGSIDNCNIYIYGEAVGQRGNIPDFGLDCNEYFSGLITNSIITGDVYINSSLSNSTIHGNLTATTSSIDNVVIDDFATITSSMVNNTLIGHSLESIGSSYYYCNIPSYMNSSGDSFVFCNMNSISDAAINNTTIRWSNIILNSGSFINVLTSNSEETELLLQYNYWGPIHTRELDNKKTIENANMSFIWDGMDDFDKAVVIYDDYKTSEIINAGYYGNSTFIPVDMGKTTYEIGDMGPAGGIIFYVDGDDEYPGWDYLEATTMYHGVGAYPFGYYRPNGTNNTEIGGTGTSIGCGKENTRILVEAMGNSTYINNIEGNLDLGLYAAKIAWDYKQGEYDDWFLPSKDELNLIYENIYTAGLCSFLKDWYWSSSEAYSSTAWYQTFLYDDGQYHDYRYYNFCVRPIRAF